MAVRTGAEYIRGLSSPREIWMGGERVHDVVTHPAFARSVEAVANQFDLQHKAELAGTLTYRPGAGPELAAATFQICRSPEDLAARRRAFEACARSTFGVFGRSPDFFNSALSAFAGAKDFFANVQTEFGVNISRFYEYARKQNLFLTRATIAPQTDRSRASFEQKDVYSNLRAVRETDAGLIVRGAKMISTNAPIADELLVFPLPGLKPGDEPYALSFCVPISSPGLRFICREPFDDGLRTVFDHPLSSRFEEIDCTCVFDDVLVPWDRLFFRGTVDVANVLYGETMARNFAGHQAMARSAVKMELLVGIAIALAESAKTNAFLHVQQALGDLLGDLEVVRALLQRAEVEASMSRWQTGSPPLEPIQAFRCVFPKINARAIETIQTLGGGSLFSDPSEADLGSPVDAEISRYFRTAGTDAIDRIKLLKLAWDISGDAFGQRQLMYEKYHAGDPVRIAAAQYFTYDKQGLISFVEEALNGPMRHAVSIGETVPTVSD